MDKFKVGEAVLVYVSGKVPTIGIIQNVISGSGKYLVYFGTANIDTLRSEGELRSCPIKMVQKPTSEHVVNKKPNIADMDNWCPPYVDKPTFNFAEALNRLESGMSVTSKRWPKGIIVSLFREPYKVLVLEDTNRKTTVTFVPSNENMFDDEWEEVENE